MGPELGLVIFVPALLFSLCTVAFEAREEQRQGRRLSAQLQATSSSRPI
jgi:hypothetical protein